MTYPRRKLVVPGEAGAFHCVTRCVRRSWLCGVDEYTGQSFEHRKHWVEARINQLGEIFALGVYSYAVMSNHVHCVVHVVPRVAYDWSDEEVARRWLCLYPPREEADHATRVAEIVADEERIALYRERLCDLSWFMKSLAEPIARRANLEDGCKGRFWEGRFWCQALLNERAMLAACVYGDLNPIRAGIAKSVATSMHTSVRERAKKIKANASFASARTVRRQQLFFSRTARDASG